MSTPPYPVDRRRGFADPANRGARASRTPVRRLTASGLALVLVAACTTGPSPSMSPSGASPSPSVGPSAESADFTLHVLPELFVGKAIGGQRVLLLVTVSGAASDGPVDVAATAAGAVVTLDQARLSPGSVGEVTVVPTPVSAEQDLVVTITATRAGVKRTAERTVGMLPGEDTNAVQAGELLARFIPWLAANRSDLGITAATTWQGTPGGWVLVVTHYLYLSKDWELDLAWHNMIPPDDWARINLRHRGSESAPSVAFEISSMSANSTPKEIPPDPAVWR